MAEQQEESKQRQLSGEEGMDESEEDPKSKEGEGKKKKQQQNNPQKH